MEEGGSLVWVGTNNLLLAATGGGGGGRDAPVGSSNAGNHGGIDLATMAPTEPNTTGGMGARLEVAEIMEELPGEPGVVDFYSMK
ncbi:MAG TPA: hypothetical protein PKC30_15165 [Saprospiraceae bacterium]|nr:hypothetical protein [Saprospiraceae bacterium]